MNEFILRTAERGNKIIFSKLTEGLYLPQTNCSEVGIKYSIQGEENYLVEATPYAVPPGHYLLVNSNQAYSADILPSEKPIVGICIFLHPDTINEVFRYANTTDMSLLDNPLRVNERSFDFLDHVYDYQNNELGIYLHSFANSMGGHADELEIDGAAFYFEVAQKLLTSQKYFRRSVDAIRSKKHVTRKELYRRVVNAKNYIDDNYLSDLCLSEIASSCALSEYHFFRTFKQTFKVTPYQYQIKKRLELASSLLKGVDSIEQIAKACKFSSTSAFSKSFKKMYKISPLQYKKAILTLATGGYLTEWMYFIA